ncbi:MAG: hypothetical protein JNL21_14840 [Myxococcales bacterium]|nr:hypothetical protein [Myxococcales bacterium]
MSAPADGQGNGVASAFSLTCSEPSCTFECSFDGAPFEPCSATPSYDRLPPGDHTFAVRATDLAGSVETPPQEHAWSLTFGYRAVTVAYRTACAISGEGALYCWGYDDEGLLGTGPAGAMSTAEPTLVDPATDWAELFSGSENICASKLSGALFCWGPGFPYGDPTDTAVESPTPFSPGGVELVSVGIGYDTLCGLDAGGAAYCVGGGYNGLLGDGDETDHYVTEPVLAGRETYTSISVGAEHACGVTEAGALFCWGYLPVEGTTASPTQVGTDSDWASVSAGEEHTCAIKVDGTLHCWGEGFSGQLGLGDTDPRVTPTQVGAETDWAVVAAGEYATCARNTAFETFCWGNNYDGQVGSVEVPNVDNVPPTPVSNGLFHRLDLGGNTTCGASQDGRVLCWGNNEEGLLGRGVTRYQASLVTIDNQFDTIAMAGDQGGCGLQGDQVLCWGYGPTVGQPDGLPRPTPTAIAPPGQWSAVATALYGSHACGIRAGVVYCWGLNEAGELGNGSTTASLAPTAIAPITGSPVFTSIAVGRSSTCAITTANELYCWGSNGYGELGIGSNTSQSTPALVAGTGWDQISLGHFRAAGHKADGTFWNWGVNATTVPAALPGSDWVSVGATGFGECGIKQDGSLHCTIQAVPGVFPAGAATSWSKVIGPGYPYCALDTTGLMSCFVSNGPNSFASSPALDGSAGWLDFEYPSSTFCGLRAGKERRCSGFRHFGSLGDGFDERMPEPVLTP